MRIEESRNPLHVMCPGFDQSGEIPKRHTGFGADISPQFFIDGLTEGVQTLAIVMDDLDVPFVGELNHWLIWNLSPEITIAEHIPHGAECPNGARQVVLTEKTGTEGQNSRPSSGRRTGIAFACMGWTARWTFRLHPGRRI